ncbi:MAG: hypothetical protein KDA84_28010, partial [Planctomycetaceae bacterium]|nr:hypothetical protein [Planctomycetaceae bacterium]
MEIPESVVSYAPEGLQERYYDDIESPEPSDLDSPPESFLISASALGAGVLTRKLLTTAWSHLRGGKPPVNPA